MSPDVGEDEDEEGDDDSEVDGDTEQLWALSCPLHRRQEGDEVVVNQAGKLATIHTELVSVFAS